MPLTMMKDLPRYDCLLAAAREYPDLDPSAVEAFLHILRTGDEALRVGEEHLSQHEISPGRFGVLLALWGKCRREGSDCFLTPAELADRSSVTRATMTGLIDTLVRDGLVTRAPHAGDRRMLSVQLTGRGQQLLDDILPEHFRRIAWLLQPLNETERRTLVGLLAKVQRQAGECPPGPQSNHSSPAAAG